MEIRTFAVHMVYVRKKGIDETVADLAQFAKWVRSWLRRYDERGLEGLRNLPRSSRPRKIPRETMDQIVNKAGQTKCTPVELQKHMHEETGTELHAYGGIRLLGSLYMLTYAQLLSVYHK